MIFFQHIIQDSEAIFPKINTVDMVQASKSGKNVISFWCAGPEEDQYYVEHCHSTSRGHIGNCGRWHFYCGTLPTALIVFAS